MVHNGDEEIVTRDDATEVRKRRLPYIYWWVRDWLGSPVLARFTPEMEGVLLRLLLHAWEAPDCRLEADEGLLANLAKVYKPDAWERVGRPVMKACFRREGEFWVPVEPWDLPAMAAHGDHLRTQRRRAGEASAAARAVKFGTAQPRTPVRQDANARSAARSGAPEHPNDRDRDNDGDRDTDGQRSTGRDVDKPSPSQEIVCRIEGCDRIVGNDGTIHQGIALCAIHASRP